LKLRNTINQWVARKEVEGTVREILDAFSKSSPHCRQSFNLGCRKQSFFCAFISDELDHNKYAVHTLPDKPMQGIISTNREADNFTFISDCIAS
jgi:hypothetical protein